MKPFLPVTLCESDETKRLVVLKKLKFSTKPSHNDVLWCFPSFCCNAYILAVKMVMKVQQEIHNNPSKYPACTQALQIGQLQLTFFSTRFFKSLFRAKIGDFRAKYKQIVMPFSEFTWNERYQIITTGSVLIDKNEPWNQAKADEIIDMLNKLQHEASAKIYRCIIQDALRNCDFPNEIIKELNDVLKSFRRN